MNRSPRRYFTVMPWLLGGVFAVLGGTPAHAQISCTSSMTPLAFGPVDPLSSSTTSTATLNYTCSNSNKNTRSATLCFSIGEPGGGPTNPRQMSSGSNRLNFQLYQDPSHSTVWGSSFFGFITPVLVNVSIPGKSSVPGSATLYGLVSAGQTSAAPGSYADNYLNSDTALTINQNNNNTAPGSCAGSAVAYFPFLVSATVIKNCTVTAGAASNIQIGAAGGVAADSGSNSGSNSISVACTNNTPYFVGLSPSNGNTTGAGQMSGTGANTDKVPYQLRSGSISGNVWGSTATATTVGNGVAGSGTGVAQSLPVFAVAPSANFTPDSYTDTVTVNVNY